MIAASCIQLIKPVAEDLNGSQSESYEKHQEYGGEDQMPDVSIVGKLMKQLNDLEEPASPSEERSRNIKEQQDEIVALQAIYGEAFTVLSNDCFMIEVPVELADEPIEVVVREQASSSSGSPGASFTLEFLPPIRFGFSFPHTYPSLSSPVFVLESQWLPSDKLALLSDQLSELWEIRRGEAIVYSWTELLHSQALSFIGASGKLVLELSTPHQLDDPRFIYGSTSQQKRTVASLLAYNQAMKEKSFLASFHTCNICLTEYLGKEFIRLPCQHSFCSSCLEQLSSIHVAEGSVNKLICPSCPETIPPFVLKKLLREETFHRYERLMLQKTLDSMSDLVYCPRCEFACIQDSDNHAQCEKCFFSFCSLCTQNWHAGRECLTPEQQLQEIEERAAQVHKPRSNRQQLRGDEKRINVLFSERALQRALREAAMPWIKPCPNCRVQIFKDGGCDSVRCSNCRTSFNWITLCSYQWEGKQPSVMQILEQYKQEEQEEQDERRLRAEESDRFPERVRRCPECGKRNPKVNNNNHITCDSCQGRYCGVCLKVVRKPADHFGPTKCKQHTEDVVSMIE